VLSVPGILDPADPNPEALDVLRDWLVLQWELALDPVAASGLLSEHGTPRAALAARAGRRDERADPDALLAVIRRVGARALPLPSPAYPPRLARLSDPSPLLLVRGDVEALTAPCVAIVGSRAATVAGLDTARTLAGDLARAGVVVVSGLALGIDAAAHRGALEAGGRTVAVLACGPEWIYPARHRELAAQIQANGAIVSELSPGTRPLPPYFPLRNRLITGLSSALVVVEARERSGSLISARHAANQGIDVFAVPGPIAAPTSAGPNRLLRDGAYVALEAADILAELHLPAAPAARSRPARASDAAAPAGGAQSLLDALEQRPATRDELCRRLGRSPERLAVELLELELAGWVALDRDGRWRPRAPGGDRH
jgi:DNA processing protein